MHRVLKKLVTESLLCQARLLNAMPGRCGDLIFDLRDYSHQLGKKRLKAKRFEEVAHVFGDLGLPVRKLPGDDCAVEYGHTRVEPDGDFIFVVTQDGVSHAWRV